MHRKFIRFLWVVLMGRFSKMMSATASENTQSSVDDLGSAPHRVRRLTLRTVPDHGRYERLKSLSLAKPSGPLRSQAIERAALVQAHTPTIAQVTDEKTCRIIARFHL